MHNLKLKKPKTSQQLKQPNLNSNFNLSYTKQLVLQKTNAVTKSKFRHPSFALVTTILKSASPQILL